MACRPEGPEPPTPGAVQRVTSRSSFDLLRREGRRSRRGPVSVTFAATRPGPGIQASAPAVAYAVGRRAGNAVHRNRLRRRLRAAMAELAPDLAPGTYLVGARAEAAALPYPELRSLLGEAARGASSPPRIVTR